MSYSWLPLALRDFLGSPCSQTPAPRWHRTWPAICKTPTRGATISYVCSEVPTDMRPITNQTVGHLNDRPNLQLAQGDVRISLKLVPNAIYLQNLRYANTSIDNQVAAPTLCVDPKSMLFSQDWPQLGQKSDGPVVRPDGKTYQTAVLHSKISRQSGVLGDASIPTTISKDTTKGIDARNKSLLATFDTKTKLLKPQRNSIFIMDASARWASSQRRVIEEKSDPTTHEVTNMDNKPWRETLVDSSVSFSDNMKSLHPNDRARPLDADTDDDAAERRRIQGRIAQRQYRKKLKRRLENLECRDVLSDDGSSEEEQVSHLPLAARATYKHVTPGIFDTLLSAQAAQPEILGPPAWSAKAVGRLRGNYRPQIAGHMPHKTGQRPQFGTAPTQLVTQNSQGLRSSRLSVRTTGTKMPDQPEIGMQRRVGNVPPHILQVTPGELLQVRNQRPNLSHIPDEKLRTMVMHMKRQAFLQQQQQQQQTPQQQQQQTP